MLTLQTTTMITMKATVATATIGIIISKWGFGIRYEKRYAQIDNGKENQFPPVRLQFVNENAVSLNSRRNKLSSYQIRVVFLLRFIGKTSAVDAESR